MHKDCLVSFGGVEFDCVDTGFGKDEPVDVVIRPEDIYLLEPDKAKLNGVVESVTFKGVHYEMVVNSGDFKWIIHDTAMFPEGKEVGIFVKPFDIHIMKK